MSAADNHTDPMLTARECKSCHVWLPCCVIDQVENRAKGDGISSSDLVLAALRDYLGEDFTEDETESSSG
ncbi:MAG: hypothetical protein R6V07_13690 [Armatimonadota bacterium]